jgi:NTP pyrophosphatase (non-canonical NTP hydrolase)
MTFKEYSDSVLPLARYPAVGNNFIYPVLGLAGEAGEAAEKAKKLWRDHGMMSDATRSVSFVQDMAECGEDPSAVLELREGLIKEASDCLWYLAALASELGITLEEIARVNIKKLHDRRDRGVLQGSGDNR